MERKAVNLSSAAVEVETEFPNVSNPRVCSIDDIARLYLLKWPVNFSDPPFRRGIVPIDFSISLDADLPTPRLEKKTLSDRGFFFWKMSSIPPFFMYIYIYIYSSLFPFYPLFTPGKTPSFPTIDPYPPSSHHSVSLGFNQSPMLAPSFTNSYFLTSGVLKITLRPASGSLFV